MRAVCKECGIEIREIEDDPEYWEAVYEENDCHHDPDWNTIKPDPSDKDQLKAKVDYLNNQNNLLVWKAVALEKENSMLRAILGIDDLDIVVLGSLNGNSLQTETKGGTRRRYFWSFIRNDVDETL